MNLTTDFTDERWQNINTVEKAIKVSREVEKMSDIDIVYLHLKLTNRLCMRDFNTVKRCCSIVLNRQLLTHDFTPKGRDRLIREFDALYPHLAGT